MPCCKVEKALRLQLRGREGQIDMKKSLPACKQGAQGAGFHRDLHAACDSCVPWEHEPVVWVVKPEALSMSLNSCFEK